MTARCPSHEDFNVKAQSFIIRCVCWGGGGGGGGGGAGTFSLDF